MVFKKSSITIDFKLIFLTAWVILFPNSDIIEKVFKDLPKKTQLFEIKFFYFMLTYIKN